MLLVRSFISHLCTILLLFHIIQHPMQSLTSHKVLTPWQKIGSQQAKNERWIGVMGDGGQTSRRFIAVIIFGEVLFYAWRTKVSSFEMTWWRRSPRKSKKASTRVCMCASVCCCICFFFESDVKATSFHDVDEMIW